MTLNDYKVMLTRQNIPVKQITVVGGYQPEVLVLPDTSAKNSRRYPRIRKLSQQIFLVATARNIRVVMLSAEKIRRVYFGNAHGTKHDLAEIIAERFPDELGSCLPPKRKPWMSEHCQMDIFDAVALVVAFRMKRNHPSLQHES